MSKILVTGANGYIGKHVFKEMINKNIDFIACDIKFENKKDDFQILESDIFKDDLSKEFNDIDTILHLAWKNGFVHNSPSHILELSEHYNFLSKAIDAGVKHIVVMGSMHEVGYYEGAIDENTPTNPMSQYAIAKNALRQSLEILCKEKGVLLQWIRAYYIFGDDLYGNSIFAKLQQSAQKGLKTFPFTSGKNKYDFLSIYDLSEQIVAVATQDEVSGIINCCSGKPLSLAEQVEWYIKENKLDIKLEYGVYPDREYDSPAIWGNNEKIQKILNSRSEKNGK